MKKRVYSETVVSISRVRMRKTGLWSLLMLLLACTVMPLNAATPADKRVSISCTDQTVQWVLDRIEAQTQHNILIRNNDVDTNRKVALSVENQSVETVLSALFAGTDVKWNVSDTSISIYKPQQSAAVRKSENRKLTGRVLDQKGNPIVGATILVEGTTVGVSSGVDGSYALEIPASVSAPVLAVSFIGYESMEIPVENRTSVEISMSESAVGLDDVVVVGYGQQKRVNVTGAVGTISGKDLNNRPVTNTAAALQGADPSLLLTMSSGSVEGKDYSVKIRGSVSLNSGSPLILVDGIETSLTQVNPNDIESVSVLKDASACSIYGAKASAGVVLISTKNGRAGELKVSYNGRFGVSWNTASTDFITEGYAYTNFVNEFDNARFGYDGWRYTEEEMQMLYDRRFDTSENADRPWVVTNDKGRYRYLGNFDWYGFLFKHSRPETEHNITMTGGNEKIDYYVSGRYLYREGLLNNSAEDTYDGYSFRAKINAKVTPWLHYSNNISFEKSDYEYGGFWEQDGTEKHATDGIFYDVARNTPPMVVPYNPDGTTTMYTNGLHYADSPLASGRIGVFTDGRNRNARRSNYYAITNRLTFDLLPNKDLKLIADHTYMRHDKLGEFRSLPTANTWDKNQKKIVSFTNGSVYDFYQEERYYRNSQIANAYLDYAHSWGDHNFSAIAGGNFEDYRSSGLTIRQKGSLSDNLSIINHQHGDINKALLDNTSYRTLGFFGRVNYDYRGKYLVELSARYDGTSRFAPGNRWAFNPSASVGWRLSEEKFWAGLRNWWDNAKIRFSYGSLGNQQVANYYYIDTIDTGSLDYTFDGEMKAGYAKASNPVTDNLSWETVTTYNLGFDFGFLRNRLNVSADLYIRDTKDMLTQQQTLPTVFGAPTPKANCADLRTKGYEITVSWRDQRTVAGKPFSYGVSASLGDYKTTITKYKNDEMLISSHYVGETLGDIWGYRTGGLFASDAEAAEYQATINDTAVNQQIYSGKNTATNHLLAGDVKFLDLDGNNVINGGDGSVNNPGDKRIIGNRLPRYIYSMRGDLSWNGFDFSIFFQGVGKINWMPDANCLYFWGPYSEGTVSFIEKGFERMCWSEDNRGAYFPRRRAEQARNGKSGALSVNTDRYLQDASYLRLKNITVGYTIPINKRIIDKLRIYVSGENLAYWSPMKKYCKTIDPEVAVTNANRDCLYPYSRTFSAGIDITF